jgi:hypothetical protein
VVTGEARRDPTWNTTLSERGPAGAGEDPSHQRVFSS